MLAPPWLSEISKNIAFDNMGICPDMGVNYLREWDIGLERKRCHDEVT